MSKSQSARVSGARLEPRARVMRQQPTLTEHILWQAIRGGRLGVTFRRQVPLGPFIVDFLAPRARLVVEVDGGYHELRVTADARRTQWLERRGYRVVRVSAPSVAHELASVLGVIAGALAQS
jgi:very-short-patch-repair endonuclease